MISYFLKVSKSIFQYINNKFVDKKQIVERELPIFFPVFSSIIAIITTKTLYLKSGHGYHPTENAHFIRFNATSGGYMLKVAKGFK